jgi:hypothetical protein
MKNRKTKEQLDKEYEDKLQLCLHAHNELIKFASKNSTGKVEFSFKNGYIVYSLPQFKKIYRLNP